MANLLWVTGDTVRAVFDNDMAAGSFEFVLLDNGSDAFRISESSYVAEIWGDIELANGAVQLGSNGGDPVVAFANSGGQLANVSESGRLRVNFGSRGGVRLQFSAPSSPVEGLCYVTSSGEFKTYLNGSWMTLS